MLLALTRESLRAVPRRGRVGRGQRKMSRKVNVNVVWEEWYMRRKGILRALTTGTCLLCACPAGTGRQAGRQAGARVPAQGSCRLGAVLPRGGWGGIAQREAPARCACAGRGGVPRLPNQRGRRAPRWRRGQGRGTLPCLLAAPAGCSYSAAWQPNDADGCRVAQAISHSCGAAWMRGFLGVDF